MRYYLHLMLWRCEEGWNSVAKGITNHASLVDQIRHNLSTEKRVLLVTFNYDRMIENALKTVEVVINTIDDYTRNATWRLFKLHGSVNWVRDVETALSMVNRGNSLEVANEIINKADQIAIGKRFAVTTELADGSGRPTVGACPAIAVPVEQKVDYECPGEHIKALTDSLGEVDRLLVIGWRATELPFLKMLATSVKRNTQAIVVSESAAGARETIRHLEKSGTRLRFKASTKGFTDFVVRNGYQVLFSKSYA